MRWIFVVALVAVMTGRCWADEPSMEDYAKYGTPGPAHAYLKQFEGKWDTIIKAWMSPGKPPVESKGTSVNRLVLGGRYLEQTYKTADFMGQPYEGFGLSGYDNARKIYTSYWADSMSTAIQYLAGSVDETGKVMTLTGVFEDPVTKKVKDVRTLTRVLSPTEHVFEYHEKADDGTWLRVMEISYRKQ